MTEDVLRLLFVEDNRDRVATLTRAIGPASDAAMDVVPVATLAEAKRRLRSKAFHLIIVSGSTAETKTDQPILDFTGHASAIPVFALLTNDRLNRGERLVEGGLEGWLEAGDISQRLLIPVLRYAREYRSLIARAERLEQALANAEPKLRTVSENVGDGVVITAPDRTMLSVNPAMANTTGRKLADLMGQSAEIVLGDDEAASWDVLVETGSTYRKDGFQLVTRDGATVACYATLSDIELSGVGGYRVLTVSPPVAERRVVEQFEQKLRGMLESGRVTAGRFQLIGLNEVKDALGCRWNRLRDRIHLITEGTIEAHLEEADTYTRTPSGAYIVCFAGTDEDQAWRKAKSIEKQIRAKVLGSGNRAADPAVIEAGLTQEQTARLGAMQVAVKEVALEVEDLPGSASIPDLINGRFEDALKAARANAAATLERLHDALSFDFRRFTSAQGTEAAFVLADLKGPCRSTVSEIEAVADNDPDLLADLDLVLLGALSGGLVRGQATGAGLVVTDVHFETLSVRRSRDRFIGLCSKLPDRLRNRLVFRIKDVPLDAYRPTVADLSSRLTAFCRFRAVQFRPPFKDPIDLSVAGVSLSFIEYEDIASMVKQPGPALAGLIKTAKRNRVRLVVDRVPQAAEDQIKGLLEPNFVHVLPPVRMGDFSSLGSRWRD
ncbi:MAG: PAS domain S-box protein [Geminicoccaceae bacterium]